MAENFEEHQNYNYHNETLKVRVHSHNHPNLSNFDACCVKKILHVRVNFLATFSAFNNLDLYTIKVYLKIRFQWYIEIQNLLLDQKL